MQREYWDTRVSFILAAIGSAIGLGNIWRFPYIAYRYGGGAFIIPYFIAMITAGIPLLILEFGLGHKTGHAAPLAFESMRKNWRYLGWCAVFVGFGIVIYYAVIMSWAFNYFFYSFKLSWGENTKDFFFNRFLGLTQGPFEFGGFKMLIVIGLVFTWVWIYLSIIKGVKSVGKVVYVTVVLPWIILLVFIIRGITLPGALEGLRYYLTPNFAALKDPMVWLNAYSQIFFSFSIGFGVMIAYASSLPPKSDIVNNAFIIGLADTGTSFLGGIAVFSTLGYLAKMQGVPVENVIASGPGLAFVTYPTIINLLPFARPLFGCLFFLMLLTLGIDSAFSLVEAFSMAGMEKWKLPRPVLNFLISLAAFIPGLIFTTRSGLFWLDIADHFISNYGLVLVGLIEAIFVGYLLGPKVIREYVNELSEIKIGKWWDAMIRVVIPLVLIWSLGFSLYTEIKSPYEGYPKGALALGVAYLGVVLLCGILMGIKGRREE